ncbi:MAG: acyl-ACP thioesterase [Treponema sp.]|nr:acyl-ACP thioesterase [Treponema sp.]
MDIMRNTFSLGFRDIDRSDRLTLAAAFDYFQEAAINHAEILGVGRESMAQTGQGWILSRMSVLMERRPKFQETVAVRSWPRGWEKLFALRDYDIRDESDTPIVRARSCWLIIDVEKRRPLRPQAVMNTLPLNEGIDALPSGAAGLEVRNNLVKTGERKAAYSDIDYNGHVNNARYIQWIQDAVQPGLLENAEKMRLDINYLNEIKPGEITDILCTPLEEAGTFAFEGRKADGAQAAFRAELRLWPDRAGLDAGA